ncbi:pectate lyase [Actinoplanes sp. LDG1-06]|uniref:Pectate lyase n=1 Tax=Paractinoplanes ovalisporus TaxID=2810368 RepID=A0ABS2AIZ7_9ACTN|nr:pectate lyase [Actinoplanes ovalisporus]MBM2619828.1 pectate lyase [Actinoplanes ovalisporus]
MTGLRNRLIAATVAVAGVGAAVVFANFADAAVPPAAGEQVVTETIAVSGVFDGENQRFIGGGDLGDGGQDEGQDPLFDLAPGATLQNVILGSPAADGVHCAGSCTLTNVHWEDVGEDAATFRGANATVVIEGGSATAADDKVFQDNRGAGGSVTIRDFEVSDFGKLYRSCGNCSTQAARTVRMENITATAPGDTLAGINVNLGDRLTIDGVTLVGDGISLCDLFEGNDTGDEPTKVGDGPDGVSCVVS